MHSVLAECNSTQVTSSADSWHQFAVHLFAGLYGQSTVREVDVVSGRVLRSQALPASDFGEGLVKLGSR